MGAIKGKKLDPVICPICGDFSSKRLTALSRHLEDVHGKTAQEVWDEMNGGRPKCACGCGGEVKWNGWWKGYSRVVNGHNGSIYAVCTPEEAAAITEKRSSSLRGKTSWAKGLSKETDKRVAARAEATSKGRKSAFERGEIKVWNKGLTKESDERMSNLSSTLKKIYEQGEAIPWAKGLNKETDPRVSRMSSIVSMALKNKSMRERLDSLKRLSISEVQRRIEESGDLEVLDGLNKYVNDASKVISVRCKKCGGSFQGSLRTLGKGRCFKCAPGGSAAQEDVARFIEKMGLKIKRNERSLMQQELDIYIPEKNIAVEYNGLYWHSHINKSPNYHNMKSKASKMIGVSLIHIFEDEWRDKRAIAESVIKAKLNMCPQKIGARKCQIVKMTPDERRRFFEENHMDGDVKSEVAWGLKFDGSFVYGLSIRRPFHKKHKDSLEVARCCPALLTSVPGGLSRLMSEAKKYCKSEGAKSIITYVDTRLGGSGRGYELAGFKKLGETIPRWWWTDMTSRFNRFKYRADSSRGMSEADVAAEAGVVKIWGCENSVYSLEL